MRKDWSSIYERELQKLISTAEEYHWTDKELTKEAKLRADEIYYDLVDRGRQEAKDREPREPLPPGGDDD